MLLKNGKAYGLKKFYLQLMKKLGGGISDLRYSTFDCRTGSFEEFISFYLSSL